MDCEWLAGLVSMGFVYKIGEIRTASSVVAEWLGLLYVEQNVSGSNFAVKFSLIFDKSCTSRSSERNESHF